MKCSYRSQEHSVSRGSHGLSSTLTKPDLLHKDGLRLKIYAITLQWKLVDLNKGLKFLPTRTRCLILALITFSSRKWFLVWSSLRHAPQKLISLQFHRSKIYRWKHLKAKLHSKISHMYALCISLTLAFAGINNLIEGIV